MFPYRRLPSHITGLYIFTVINFLILCHLALVEADISVISLKTNDTVVPFIADMPSYFGGHINYDGIWGQTVYSSPANACEPIMPPPINQTIEIPGVKWFVLIKRGDCTFSKKVLNAQLAGFEVAIVHNVNSNQLEPMGPDRGIVIPSVFIGETDGLAIKNLYTYEKGFVLFLNDDFPDPFWSGDLNKYLLPFAFLLAVCFIVSVVTVIVKCVRDRNRRLRHRLPTRLLKKLPIQKFKKGDPYDMCAICLEEYIEGEKLRVLPCSHTYHTKCIDPWLTESRRTCPVCKRKVLPRSREERHGILSSISGTESDSESDSDAGGNANEHTPLLAPGNNPSGALNVQNQPVLTPQSSASGTPTLSTTPSSLPSGVPSTSTTLPGGRYQSFNRTGSLGSISLPGMQLFVQPPGGGGGDLVSSGDHSSVNGDLIDFAPTQIHPSDVELINDMGGPAEIVVEVSARRPTTSSNNRIINNSRTDCDLVV
ncbi:E3 ubiquitin-protein ligase rnf13 [Chamberlinius hualienensis]